MKCNIIDFVAQLPNWQQLKYEYQRLEETFQIMHIPKWKWERIAMYFVFSHLKTLGKFDTI